MGEQVVMSEPSPAPAFFAVGRAKLTLMFFGTLGFYGLHWFYENWRLIKARSSARFNPFRRTLLAPFFSYLLFRRIRSAADEDRIPTAFSPSGAAFVHILGALVGTVLVDELWPAALLLIYLPICAAQHVANEVNAVRAPGADPNATFSPGNKVTLALGGLLFLVALRGAYYALLARLGGV